MDSIRQRTALLAFGLVFIIILVNALVSYRNIRRMRETASLVNHTYDVISAINKLLTGVSDAETGQRGFLITTDENFLKPFNKSAAQIDSQLAELKRLMIDNAPQSERLAELKPIVDARMDTLREGLRQAKEGGPEKVKEFLLEGSGKKLMDQIRERLKTLEDEERRLLKLRDIESDSAYTTAVVSGVVSAVFGLILAVAAYVLVVREVRQQAEAAENLRAANDQLEARVQQRTETIQRMVDNLQTEVAERHAAERAVRQTADELQRSNRELESFASVASHDLQEPLRKIQAFADRLDAHIGRQFDEKSRGYLDRILNSASRMRRLIDDLLAFSRVTTKGQSMVAVDLNLVVAEVLGDLEERIRQTEGRVNVSLFPTIEADPVQMRQLFQNLIANGLKFHRPDAPPEISITSRIIKGSSGSESEGAILEVTVKDNGIGFEPEYKERIFQLFQRLHGRDGYEGTGIGLAICKKIVERHGGTISAEAVPGDGATFTLTLSTVKVPARV